MAFEFQDTKKELHHAKLWHNKQQSDDRIPYIPAAVRSYR